MDFQRFASDNAQLIEKHQLHRDHVVMELADMTGDTVLLGGSRQQQVGVYRSCGVVHTGGAILHALSWGTRSCWAAASSSRLG